MARLRGLKNTGMVDPPKVTNPNSSSSSGSSSRSRSSHRSSHSSSSRSSRSCSPASEMTYIMSGGAYSLAESCREEDWAKKND